MYTLFLCSTMKENVTEPHSVKHSHTCSRHEPMKLGYNTELTERDLVYNEKQSTVDNRKLFVILKVFTPLYTYVLILIN